MVEGQGAAARMMFDQTAAAATAQRQLRNPVSKICPRTTLPWGSHVSLQFSSMSSPRHPEAGSQTGARAPLTNTSLPASVRSARDWVVVPNCPSQHMALISTPQSFHGLIPSPLPLGSMSRVPNQIDRRIRSHDETSVVTETNNLALYEQDKKDHKKE
jgi:hypothetical protein